jgi:hypothetical protein
MLWFFTNLLKYGGTAFELHHCRTASCDPFSCGQKALTHLKQTTRYKRRDLLSEGVLLLHDTRVRLPRQPPLKQSSGWNLNFSHTPTLIFKVNLTTISDALDTVSSLWMTCEYWIGKGLEICGRDLYEALFGPRKTFDNKKQQQQQPG